MTRLRTLAASVRPLADVLVDSLRRANKPCRAGGPDDPDDDGGQSQLKLRLDDDADASISECDPPSPLPPDEVAVAVLLGRALDRHRDVLARLRDPDLIAMIELPAAEFLLPIARLLRTHVLGGEAPVLDGVGLSGNERSIAATGTVAIFKGLDTDKPRKPSSDNGSTDFALAMQRRCAVIGIANDPERQLPRDLVRLAEHRIVVSPLDGEAIATVIAAVTGRHPGPIDDDLVRGATLESLSIALRADLGAERSLTRLHRILGRDQNADRGPRLADLHGLGAAKDWGLSLVGDLQDYAAGRLPWAAVDKGCLLTGLPGTGKTTFARALAQEAGVHFIATSYSQWQAYKEGHLGHVTQAIRNAFAEAQRRRPAILFIDEIDTIPARGTGKWNDDWWTSITNTLLECLDGFERRDGVVVIAACNDPSRLDAALVRAGRLDRHIEIPLPDLPALVGIFRSHLGEDLHGADLRAAALAARGGTGADVERWVREARRRARLAGRMLTKDDLLDAVRGGEPDLPADMRRRFAYHEAGHAIAGRILRVFDPVALSINGLGGLAQSEPGEKQAQTRTHLAHYLVFLLAGRAAEQLVFGEVTAGAGGGEMSDLSRATALALRIETSYGLGQLGHLWIGDQASARDLLLFDDLRAAVRHMVDEAHAAATELLSQHRPTLDRLAEALFAAGYLDRDEIEALLKHTPVSAQAMTAARHQAAPSIASSVHGEARLAGAAGDVTPVAPASASQAADGDAQSSADSAVDETRAP